MHDTFYSAKFQRIVFEGIELLECFCWCFEEAQPKILLICKKKIFDENQIFAWKSIHTEMCSMLAWLQNHSLCFYWIYIFARVFTSPLPLKTCLFLNFFLSLLKRNSKSDSIKRTRKTPSRTWINLQREGCQR